MGDRERKGGVPLPVRRRDDTAVAEGESIIKATFWGVRERAGETFRMEWWLRGLAGVRERKDDELLSV